MFFVDHTKTVGPPPIFVSRFNLWDSYPQELIFFGESWTEAKKRNKVDQQKDENFEGVSETRHLS